MVHTVSEYTARVTILSRHYVEARQIIEVVDNLILSILLRQQQNDLKANQTKGV
jgi:hypothetical protein